MYFKAFEDLNLVHKDRLFMVNGKGECCYGNYLGAYNPDDHNFSFLNNCSVQKEVIDIATMERIHRTR